MSTQTSRHLERRKYFCKSLLQIQLLDSTPPTFHEAASPTSFLSPITHHPSLKIKDRPVVVQRGLKQLHVHDGRSLVDEVEEHRQIANDVRVDVILAQVDALVLGVVVDPACFAVGGEDGR